MTAPTATATMPVMRLQPAQMDLIFERAKVTSFEGSDITATFLNDRGELRGLTATLELCPGVKRGRVIGRQIEVLVEPGYHAGRIYGARLVGGEVIADSVEERFDSQWNNFDVGRVRGILYETP